MTLLVILLILHFVPTVIAVLRGHHNRLAIFALNLLLGWSMIGWVIALVWSLTRPAPVRIDRRTVPPQAVRALGLQAVAAELLPAPKEIGGRARIRLSVW